MYRLEEKRNSSDGNSDGKVYANRSNCLSCVAEQARTRGNWIQSSDEKVQANWNETSSVEGGRTIVCWLETRCGSREGDGCVRMQRAW